MFVLALDVGSSSVRAFVYDQEGRRVGGAKLAYAWRTWFVDSSQAACQTRPAAKPRAA